MKLMKAFPGGTLLVPMFIYGLTSPTEINFMPLMSILFPLLIGIIIGNLDKDLAKYLSSGMNYIIFFLGWTVGAGINLLDALKSGLPGILMVLLYYLISLLSRKNNFKKRRDRSCWCVNHSWTFCKHSSYDDNNES